MKVVKTITIGVEESKWLEQESRRLNKPQSVLINELIQERLQNLGYPAKG